MLAQLVTRHHLSPADTIADPWNGSGTTTQIASDMGMSYWGSDVNPAMVVVAKARLLSLHVTPSELSLSERIIADAARTVGDACIAGDPLRRWFTDETASQLRAIEQRIAVLLDPSLTEGTWLAAVDRVSALSALASFFYLALFRLTRELLRPFRASNPTWMKTPLEGSDRIGVDAKTVCDGFRRSVRDMVGTAQSVEATLPFDWTQTASLHNAAPSADETAPNCPLPPAIHVASSTALPLPSQSMAAVVSSPPYCTRIDYAVSTGPELAILGMTDQRLRALRDEMIGTSTIHREQFEVDPTWGKTCERFLTAVKEHPSKASKTYYLKNHLQYFDGIARSLREINRVLRPGAPCVLVVQDSYYKECHNDLPTIVTEMGESLGWQCIDRFDYTPKHHFRRINQKAQKYQSRVSATESVLVLTTGR